MSLLYKQGFFPFPIVDNSLITEPDSTGVAIPGLGLATLTKLFWLAKSFDWSMDLAYTFVAVHETASGTVTGGQTTLIETSATLPRGTGALPGERVTVFDTNLDDEAGLPLFGALTGGSGWDGFGAFTDSGTTTGYPAGPYSHQRGFLPTWFNPQYGAALANPVPVTKSGSNYITILDDGGSFEFGPEAGTPPAGGPTAQLSLNSTFGAGGPAGINLTLKIAGIPDTLLPLYYVVGGSGFTTSTMTGSIIIDFNNFWTP